VAGEARAPRVAEIEDLRHPRGPPVRERGRGISETRAVGHEVSDARVALPPALVRVSEVGDHYRRERWAGRVGDVPDLVAVGGGPKDVNPAGDSVRENAAVAGADHLGAAGLADAGPAR